MSRADAAGASQLAASQLLELNDDTLSELFALLPLDARARLATACRRLRRVASLPSLWKELRFAGVTCRVADPYATLRSLLERARANSGDAFSVFDLGGSSLGARLVEVSANARFCDAVKKLRELLAAEDALGESLVELGLGDAFAILPLDAALLAAYCPRLRSATFRLAFDGPGSGAVQDGARLPRGCHVSVETGGRRLLLGIDPQDQDLRDLYLRDAFSAMLTAVGAAGGSVSAVSTHSYIPLDGTTVAGLLALATTSPAALAALKKLDLRQCAIPPDGERSALITVLGSCPQLQSVRLCGHSLTHLELRAVAALPTLSFLDVSCRAPVAGTDYAAALRAGLDAAANAGHRTRRLALVASLCALRDAGAAELAAALSGGAGVRRLYLAENGISDAGATALADALVACGRAGQALRASSLHLLNLAFNDVGVAGVNALARALRARCVRLRRLELCGNAACGDAGAVALAEALMVRGCSLEELRMRRCGVGSSGARALSAAFGAPAVSALAPRAQPMLKFLELDQNAIGDNGAVSLAEGLAMPGCALEHLSLDDCGVKQRGALALAAALRRNSSLKLLRLTSNAVTKRGLAALLAALGGSGRGARTNSTLTKLYVPRRLRPEVSAQTLERLQDRVAFR